MIVFLNGGPQVGKTTAARIMEKYLGFKVIRLTDPFESFVKQTLNINDDEFRQYKDQTSFMAKTNVGHTIRQAMIDIADTMEKFDSAIWMKACMKHGGVSASDDVVVDQVGKIDQWEWVLKTYNPWDIRLVRVTTHEEPVFANHRYSDGRHRISAYRTREVRFLEMVNTPESKRSDKTLLTYVETVTETVALLR